LAGGICFASVLVAAGCAGNSLGAGKSSPATGRGALSETRATDNYAASNRLNEAKRMVKAGEYSLVIPRLQQLTSQFPGDQAAIEARYYLGLSYFNIGGYGDALQCFKEYTELAPQGENTASAQEYIQRMTQNAPATPAEKDGKILDALARSAAKPDDATIKLELANLYWDAARYDEAGRVYADLLAKWPNLMNDTVVRTRVAIEKNGTLTVLSPQETERRYREQDPLQIFNVSSFRSGRFEDWNATARERYYNVAGQAVNRSERPLEDVRITVTIYGMGQMVYDTQTTSLGTLQPGETRAFSVQFSKFDNIFNVTRQDCVGTFRR
jgi:tetratricopeptide (TPR) repeat protein